MSLNEIRRKPVIGFLGIMQQLYDKVMPSLTAHQEAFAREVVGRLADTAEVLFPKAARCREDIEEIMAGFAAAKVDGILIVNLTYGPALRMVNAFRDVSTPLLLANIQPEPGVTKSWTMDDLTYNHGIHGSQDTANSLLHLGKKFIVWSGNWKSDEFIEVFETFATAAHTVTVMKQTKIAVFGRMPGMGDILSDPFAFTRRLGPQIDHYGMGSIVTEMDKATKPEIDAVLDYARANFDIDPTLKPAQMEEAAKIQVGITRMLEQSGYDAFSLYFDEIGLDGRFSQIHMMAASNLMAEGYGYSAEGDTNVAALMVAGRVIAPDPHFTEMYAMDFKLDAALQSHMGEGNWKVGRKDRRPRLINRPLSIGGLDNPPTVLFQGEPGPATLVSLVTIGEQYRLVVAGGNILDTEELPAIEMPYFFFKPNTGVRACLDGWLRNGGTHHQVLHLGDTRAKWKAYSEFAGIEYVEV
ncbi:MAG: L-fucose/L-arabinose isomerase family protein [Bradyrhizobium sp.]|nr:L-fucose/L-arabinose isomerase family protein [Bradyrhizobium sp.]